MEKQDTRFLSIRILSQVFPLIPKSLRGISPSRSIDSLTIRRGASVSEMLEGGA
jgi:hypothetical protein